MMTLFDTFLEILLIFEYVNKANASTGSGGLLKSDQKHRTQKAAEKANELLCYKCQTMDVTQNYCMNVSQHDKEIQSKCQEDRRICMVKKVSFMSINENATIGHKTWSLERDCTNRCEPGCIVIGDRNKIHICWTCCETSFCNKGSGDSSINKPVFHYLPILFIIYFIFIQYSKYNG